MEYLLKVTAVVTIFYTIYKLFLQRDTFFESNRWFLIIGLIASLMIPFLVIPIYIEYTPTFYNVTINGQVVTETVEKPFNVLDYLPLIYGLGIVFFSVRFFIQLLSLIKIIYRNSGIKKDGFVFIETQNNTSPFSFFKWIVYNPEVFNPTELEHIIEHEKTHAKQYHSIDILITQLFCVLLWFNPFIWLYNKDLKQNLEFIADKRTLNQYNCKKSYQYTLLKTSMPSHQMALSNHFYNSLIKKRIVMLHKSKSKKINQLKYALVIPIVALFLMGFNTEEIYVSKVQKNNNLEKKIAETYTINKNTSDIELNNIKSNLKLLDSNEFVISGTVTDINDKPFEKVMVTNGNSGVVTNTLGQYKLKANLGEELIFSYEGMQTQKIKVNNNKTIDIKLTPKTASITKPQSSWTTSLGINKDFILTGDEPLYIVDGQEVSNNIIKALDPENIESITILKDENALKKYGEKGENGVVLISLKKSTKLSNDVKVIGFATKPDSTEKRIVVMGKPTNEVKVIGYGAKPDSTYSKTIRSGYGLNVGKDKHPLVIVDGKKSSHEELNPDKIESITVLKAETATKKYGKKAKNGVIIITTKK